MVYGCEMDAAKAHLAAAFANVDVCDVRRWIPPGPLDLILCAELLEHLPTHDQLPFMRSMRTWLKPGGYLVLSTPQRHSPVAIVERAYTRLRGKGDYDWWDPTHIGVLSRRELEGLFTTAGFNIKRRVGTHIVPELLPIPALHRTTHEGMLSAFGFDLAYLLV